MNRMCKTIVAILTLLSPLMASAQEEAVTSSGKIVLLYPDSTWKLKTISSDSTQVDSLAVLAPEKHKEYTDTSTGFRGFLKPELKLPALPERSHGDYAFRVKVNKEGWVKEITTTLRGPNGEAERLMRNTILKLKYKPDGSIVPPLTEGVIRISVPAGR